MRFWVATANGCINSSDNIHWIHQNNETFKPNLGDLIRAKYTFVVLRDPFRRLASCYLDKFVGQTNTSWHYYDCIKRKIEPQMLTFKQFVTSIPEVLRENIHWRPQIDFLVYEQYDDWFCVEDFAMAAETLSCRIGLTVVDTRPLLKHGTESHRRARRGKLNPESPAHEHARLRRAGSVANVEDLYDEDLIAIVGRAYAEDIALYRDVTGRKCLFEGVA